MMPRKKPVMICLVGIDGAGKTSLAQLVAKTFPEKGVPIRYVYGGLQAYLLRPVKLITAKILLRKVSQFEEYERYSQRKTELSTRYGLFAKAYASVYWLDFALQVFFKISIPVLLQQNLVVDRYVYDVAINLGMNTYQGRLPWDGLDCFLKLFPRPTHLYLIDIDEETAFARKSDTPAVKYLTERRNQYFQIIERYGGRVIDGTLPRNEQVQQIYDDVHACLAGDDG